VCLTLFEKDKLLFSFNLVVKLLILKGEVDPEHFKHFLTGPTDEQKYIATNAPNWIDQITWTRILKFIYSVSKLNRFDGFNTYFIDNTIKFKKIITSDDPRSVQFPGEWNEKLDQFQKILVLKALRPDILMQCITHYIKDKLGEKFISQPLLNLEECYLQTSKAKPIIFITTPGCDPLTDV